MITMVTGGAGGMIRAEVHLGQWYACDVACPQGQNYSGEVRMRIEAGTARGWAAALVPALAAVLAGTGAVAGAAAGTPHGAAVHAVSVSAQRAARAYWTPARIAAATPVRGGLA